VKATAEKHERGLSGQVTGPLASRSKKPREVKPKAAIVGRFWLNPSLSVRVSGSVMDTLEGRATVVFERGRNPMRDPAFERAYGAAVRMKAAKGEPQKWDRDETSPIGHAGSKASRGRETSRAQRNRCLWEMPGVCGSVWLEKHYRGTQPRKGQAVTDAAFAGRIVCGGARVILCRGVKA
jgi:hypothetical protein